MNLNKYGLHLHCAFVVLVGLSSPAAAQSVAYKAFGTQAAYDPVTGEYHGSGTGTHLGKHMFFGDVALVPTSLLTADWQSTTPQETVAADGSKLYFDSAGTVELIPLDNLGNFIAVWSGEFSVVGGTGRFQGAGPANEPLTVVAVNDPFNIFTDPVWTFSWQLTGRIDLGK